MSLDASNRRKSLVTLAVTAKWIEYLEKTKFLVENIDRGIVKIMYVVLRLI
jgi:hypothetical protein